MFHIQFSSCSLPTTEVSVHRLSVIFMPKRMMYCWQLLLGLRRSSRQHIAVFMKIGEMEQASSEMF